jgi:hypothetical protein
MARYKGGETAATKRVLQEVIAAGREGIWQTDIVKGTGLNRSYVFEIAMMLRKDGKIAIRRTGNRTKYFAKSKVVVDPALGSFLQGRYALRKLLKKNRPVFGRNVLVVNTEGLSKLQLSLIIFSLNLGATITYLLLDAISKRNKILADAYYGTSGQEEREKKTAVSQTDQQKEELIKDWIRNAITSIIPLLPIELKKVVYRAAIPPPLSYEQRINLMRKSPRVRIEETVAQQANDAFEKILEDQTARTLQRLSETLQSIVDYEKILIERAENSDTTSPLIDKPAEAVNLERHQQNEKWRRHSHKFNVIEVGDRYYYEKCKICGLEEPRQLPPADRQLK